MKMTDGKKGVWGLRPPDWRARTVAGCLVPVFSAQ